MNKIKFLMIALSLVVVSTVVSQEVHAATCDLVDPIQGDILVTCTDATLYVSQNGSRYLPNPATVSIGTKLTIKWVQPFSGNTQVISWDANQQRTHFWENINGVWVNIPDNSIMQENGNLPKATIKVMAMPDGTKGWAVIRTQDLMIWNGGN